MGLETPYFFLLDSVRKYCKTFTITTSIKPNKHRRRHQESKHKSLSASVIIFVVLPHTDQSIDRSTVVCLASISSSMRIPRGLRRSLYLSQKLSANIAYEKLTMQFLSNLFLRLIGMKFPLFQLLKSIIFIHTYT